MPSELEILFVGALIFAVFPLASIIVAIVAIRNTGKLSKRIEELEDELHRLTVRAPTPAQVQIPAAVPVAPIAPPSPPTPISAAPVAAPVSAAPVATPRPAVAPVQPASPSPPRPTPAPPSPTPRPVTTPSGLEERIGGIWLQNVGSVLLLLGSFFLIFWGYTQGKIGPIVLVLAGIAFGVVLAWRGDVIAKTIHPLGHALLGVGLGVVYITIYLGHFQMHALPQWPTLGLLALVSFITIDLGLQRTQPVIAGLGVFGAFVPLLLSALPGLGFRLPYPMMLGYLALVNAVFIVLTALRGWSGLCLLALFLTPIVWANNWNGMWSPTVQYGLSALFIALGLAPAVRMARSADSVKPSDLAVTGLAPMLLLLVSIPYFQITPPLTAGRFLLTLGAVQFLAALWVDRSRPQRDLWRPLTGAGTVFVTAALERLLTPENLSLAWCVEGAVLVWLGLSARGGWFRALGYAVCMLGAIRLTFFPGSYDPVAGGAGLGVVNGTALRDLLCIVVLIIAADRVSRRRKHLASSDRSAPSVWLVATNFLVMVWLAREAAYLARLVQPHPDITGRGALFGPSPVATMPMVVLLWTAQMAALVGLSWVRRSAGHRHVAYLLVIGIFPLYLAVVADASLWRASPWILPYPTVWILLVTLVLFFVAARLLWAQRDAGDAGTPGAPTAFATFEHRAPEVAVVLANLALMLWSAREASRVAWTLASGPGIGIVRSDAAVLGTVLTSAAWALQVAALVVLARVRRSAAHRYIAYVLASVTFLVYLFAIAGSWTGRRGEWIASFQSAPIMLAIVALLFVSARVLWGNRNQVGVRADATTPTDAAAPPDAFRPFERRVPEVAVSLANVALMLWTTREAGDLAWRLAPGASFGAARSDAGILTAVLMSTGWLLQAGGLFALGWIRRSAFYRWLALAIVALTLLKFVFSDLQRVDVFWRFVIALVFGAALILVSFIYQRAQRAAKSPAP